MKLHAAGSAILDWIKDLPYGKLLTALALAGVVGYGVGRQQERSEASNASVFERIQNNTAAIQQNTAEIQENTIAITTLTQGQQLILLGQRRMSCLITLDDSARARISRNPAIVEMQCP